MPQARVLLVDDDPSMLTLYSYRLQACNCVITTAQSGTEALEALNKELPDLVITDLRMENMDGLALFDRIQAQWPSLPVIIFTAQGSIREAVNATQKGVFSFLTKPPDKDELVTTINQALQLSRRINIPHGEWQALFSTRSAKMHALIDQAKLLASSDVNVLISGESGAGKEVLARSLHRYGDRSDKPFVAINCGAMPGELLESELFGHVKGAFTGAARDHEGLFVAADGGVLFLDEIGDMPLVLQSKLLRVLQEKTVRPLGGTKDRAINVRIISATHQNLTEAIKNKTFREDLFYRLNVVNLKVPPLRERKEDIPLMVTTFLDALAKNHNMTKQLAPQALVLLLSYDWPGNVRQLKNVIEQVYALSTSAMISPLLIENAIPDLNRGDVKPLTEAKQEFERDYVIGLLKATQGNMAQAAILAGRNRSDFYKICKRYDLDSDSFKS
ncbi:MAG TPA: sigma 54-interacting transcriptional regulator [Cellvibrionaceae bacterium]|nr:sigma 54-interacting transcriptional regulator [Cellvibrionaceae bacterium]HMY39194.1 sigma 54-interacting transcriptional regulator [Marinagarivorans sp.]HNG60553.1 sigma 54-interacting transcriptional regulator [Cellvibrionaceae bacterium]